MDSIEKENIFDETDGKFLISNLDLEGYECHELSELIRIYYKTGEGRSCRLYVTSFCEGVEDEWTHANLWFEGVIYFDGLRHLFMGDSQNRHGYIYYPDTEDMIKIFEFIRNIEEKLECMK